MPRLTTIQKHPLKDDINEDIRAGVDPKDIAQKYGITTSMVKHHVNKNLHFEGAPEWAHEQLRDRLTHQGWKVDTTHKMTVLAKIAERECIRVIGKARKEKKLEKLAFTAMDKWRAVLSDLHRMQKEAPSEAEIEESAILTPVMQIARKLSPALRAELIEALRGEGYALDDDGNVVLEEPEPEPLVEADEIRKIREKFRKAIGEKDAEDAWKDFLAEEYGEEFVSKLAEED